MGVKERHAQTRSKFIARRSGVRSDGSNNPRNDITINDAGRSVPSSSREAEIAAAQEALQYADGKPSHAPKASPRENKIIRDHTRNAGTFIAACMKKTAKELGEANMASAAKYHRIPVAWAKYYRDQELSTRAAKGK